MDTSSATLRAGQRFILTGRIKIENTGTTSIANPSIGLYLTPRRNDWSGAIYLKTLRLNATALRSTIRPGRRATS
jgi:hypothetical protein